MNHISVGRRLLLASIGVALSTMLFRAQLADALVNRGDDLLFRNQLGAARLYYGRAMQIDPSSAVAVDRFAFFGMEQRTARAIAESVEAASWFLAKHPDNSDVLLDRALCYQLRRQYALAAQDFADAAKKSHDARYYTFAGWAALRAGRPQAARQLWRAALQVRPAFEPARHALQTNGPAE
ncbi:MAG: hypothetical protein M3Y21_05815 [Candidatus Eremiobacteraeota bacterium]|nr:hypothetical protein [Candidatus Eremiobacteraeota bacterium]